MLGKTKEMPLSRTGASRKFSPEVAEMPAAGTKSLLAKGRIDSELNFTPGVYESMSRKALLKDGKEG